MSSCLEFSEMQSVAVHLSIWSFDTVFGNKSEGPADGLVLIMHPCFNVSSFIVIIFWHRESSHEHKTLKDKAMRRTRKQFEAGVMKLGCFCSSRRHEVSVDLPLLGVLLLQRRGLLSTRLELALRLHEVACFCFGFLFFSQWCFEGIRKIRKD